MRVLFRKIVSHLPIFVAIASALFVYWLLGIYGQTEVKRFKRESEELLHRQLDQNRSAVEQKIAGQKNIAQSLAEYVEFNPQINRQIFSKWVQQVFLGSHPQSLTFSIVSDSSISFNYPKGDEQSKVQFLLKQPIFRTLKLPKDSVNKELVFFDTDLLNGKPAIVYQNFIYTTDTVSKESKFLGSVVIIDDLETILKSVPFKTNSNRKFRFDVETVEGDKISIGEDLKEGDLHINEFFQLQSLTVRMYLSSSLLGRELEDKSISLRVLFGAIAILIALLNAYLISNMYRMRRINRILASKNKQIKVQLTEKVLLIKEIHHRIKNHFQLISSLNRTSTERFKEKTVDEIVGEINNRIELMAKAYDQINGGSNVNNYMPDYINSIVESLILGVVPEISCELKIIPVDINIKRAVYLGILLNELIMNTLKHGFVEEEKDRKIKIEFKNIADRYVLKYSENGKGLPENVLGDNSESTGMQVLTLFTRQLEGDIVQFKEGEFCGFEIEFPV